MQIEPETIAVLSPYWTQHINRFGRSSLGRSLYPLPSTMVSLSSLKVIRGLIFQKNRLLKIFSDEDFKRCVT